MTDPTQPEPTPFEVWMAGGPLDEEAVKAELQQLRVYMRRILRGYYGAMRLAGKLGAMAEERSRRMAKEAVDQPWLDGTHMGEAFAWSRAANLLGYINRSMIRALDVDVEEPEQ